MLVYFFEVVAVDELELDNFVKSDSVDFEKSPLEGALSRAQYKSPLPEIVFVFLMRTMRKTMIQEMIPYSDWSVAKPIFGLSL